MNYLNLNFLCCFILLKFFIDKDSFAGLNSLIDKNKFVSANDEKELYTIISTIIKSESTLRLIKRLMAI